MQVTGLNVDDLQPLGRPLVNDPTDAKVAGLPIHLFNSVGPAATYAAVGRDRLPGPSWLRGVIFATIENTVLYPIAALEELHPGIEPGGNRPVFHSECLSPVDFAPHQ